MENLIDTFGSSFNSLTDSNHPREDEFSTSYLYKYRQYTGLKQEERRQDLLEYQKGQRSRNFDESRGILDLIDEPVTSKGYKPLYVPGFGKAFRKYENLLMFSEWLVEKPSDLDTNWYALPCPTGKRVLVVHSKNSSDCYDKYGRYLLSFSSALSQVTGFKYAYTILDCVWSKENSTFYILDVLVWNNYSVANSPTEFRQYWIQSKFADNADLMGATSKFKYHFQLLPKINCTSDELNQTFSKFPYFSDNNLPLDGWLFYHKLAIYKAGTTPLVGWLKPYMINEILGDDITVHKSYLLDRPKDYTDQDRFIKQFDENLAEKKSKHKRGRRSSKKINDDGSGSTCVEMESLDQTNGSSSFASSSGEMDSSSQACHENDIIPA